MEWVIFYQNKNRNLRLTMLGIWFLSILITVLCGVYIDDGFKTGGICLAITLVLFFVTIIVCCSVKVAWRKYNDNYIIFYASPTLNYLIVNGEIECSGGMTQGDYYAQLPDGTDIHVNMSLWTGSVKFSIGKTENHTISFI